MKRNALWCHVIACFLVSGAVWVSTGSAASLDDLYAPLLDRGQYFYQAEISKYAMTEEGAHGSTSFSRFESDPSLLSAYHSLRFLPVADVEIESGYRHTFPSDYTRLTYDGPTSALNTVADYTLHYFQDYSFKARYRRGSYETFFRFQEKRQKAKTDTVLLLGDTVVFDDIYSHFEDLQFGVRYLSPGQGSKQKAGYFDRLSPLLSDGQLNVAMDVGFRNGKLKNSSDATTGSTLRLLEYTHQLRPHFIPEVLLRYGVSDRLQVEGGLSYTSPFKYNYEFQRFNPTTQNFITGTYKTENNIKAPVKFTYRPSDRFSVMVSSNFIYIKQRLDSWEKETDDSVTSYAVRRLRAFNTKPTLELAYLFDADRPVARDELSLLTKPLLSRGQWLVNFQYQRDITNLLKDDDNAAQNVIDPYNAFLYPLDLFVSGTEYGVFFLGNKTTRAANVQPQNYYNLETSLTYGLMDHVNAGITVGYRSANSLHHHSVHDLIERFYRFQPYNYFNFSTDWKVKENSLLSFKLHYVPQYKTFLETSADPKQFESVTRYYEASLALKILF